MKFDAETAAKFNGGEVEIQNQGLNTTYRGKVVSAQMDTLTNILQFEYGELARATSSQQTHWVRVDLTRFNPTYNLDFYEIKENLGPDRQVGGDDRWMLRSSIEGNVIMLFPANGDKLDWSCVEDEESAAA